MGKAIPDEAAKELPAPKTTGHSMLVPTTSPMPILDAKLLFSEVMELSVKQQKVCEESKNAVLLFILIILCSKLIIFVIEVLCNNFICYN